MRFFEKKYQIIGARALIAVLVVTLVGTVALIVIEGRRAQASSPFGGMVTSVFYCNCSFNYRLTISPPFDERIISGTLMYQPGATVVYEFYMIPVVGVWLLGLYGAPTACMIYVVKGCSSLGSYPVIEMTGTSM
jgi:hypothetical protein